VIVAANDEASEEWHERKARVKDALEELRPLYCDWQEARAEWIKSVVREKPARTRARLERECRAIFEEFKVALDDLINLVFTPSRRARAGTPRGSGAESPEGTESVVFWQKVLQWTWMAPDRFLRFLSQAVAREDSLAFLKRGERWAGVDEYRKEQHQPPAGTAVVPLERAMHLADPKAPHPFDGIVSAEHRLLVVSALMNAGLRFLLIAPDPISLRCFLVFAAYACFGCEQQKLARVFGVDRSAISRDVTGFREFLLDQYVPSDRTLFRYLADQGLFGGGSEQ
jgi:hypothetical protein